MIESFKFLAHHIRTCGEDSIRVISEEVDDYVDQLHTEYNEFLEETKHLFPHSNDWAFLDRWKKLSVEELKEKWVEENKIKHEEERTKINGVLKTCEIIHEGDGLPYFYARVMGEDGQSTAVTGSTRQLPVVDGSYIIIGVKRDHPELGEVLEIHKMIPES
ncbi:hypothetical protein [Brevibacillus choshinensis]|uniref:hypothetical protein n=1 Tax=Brevibacillus choshinensis TaxID=54911 RepID=UPI001EEEABE0|nr:hypothetical protein [Brevibacillus choshinensis]